MFKKILKAALFTPLFLASCLFIMVFAFAGMWAIFPNLIAASAAALFGVMIDGEMYRQNIWEGLRGLLHPGSYIKFLLLKALFDEQLEANENSSTPFGEYQKISEYLEELKQYESKKDKKWKKQEVIRAKKQRARIFKQFSNFMFGKGDEITFANAFSEAMSEEKRALFLTTYRSKQRQKAAGMVISVTGGIALGLGSGFLFLLALNLFGIVLAPWFVVTIVLPLTLLVAAAYTVNMHKTFNDIIAEPRFQKYKQKVVQYFRRKENETNLHCWMRRILAGVGLGLIVIVSVLATMATCGTSWWAAKNGAALIPKMKGAADWIRDVAVPIFGVSWSIFGFDNTADSISTMHQIPIKIKQKISKMKSWPFKEWAKEWLNPFRMLTNILEFVARGVFFLLYIFTDGLMGNHVGNISPIAATMVGAIDEGVGQFQYAVSEPGHSDIAGIFIKTVFSPLYVLSALMYFGARLISKAFSKKKTKQESEGQENKKGVGALLIDSFKWSFGIGQNKKEAEAGKLNKLEPENPKQVEPVKPKLLSLSKSLQLFNCQQDLEDEITRLRQQKKGKKLRDEKVKVWEGLQKDLSSDGKKGKSISDILKDNKLVGGNDGNLQILGRHRWGLFRNKNTTTSVDFLEEFSAQYKDLTLHENAVKGEAKQSNSQTYPPQGQQLVAESFQVNASFTVEEIIEVLSKIIKKAVMEVANEFKDMLAEDEGIPKHVADEMLKIFIHVAANPAPEYIRKQVMQEEKINEGEQSVNIIGGKVLAAFFGVEAKQNNLTRDYGKNVPSSKVAPLLGRRLGGKIEESLSHESGVINFLTNGSTAEVAQIMQKAGMSNMSLKFTRTRTSEEEQHHAAFRHR